MDILQIISSLQKRLSSLQEEERKLLLSQQTLRDEAEKKKQAETTSARSKTDEIDQEIRTIQIYRKEACHYVRDAGIKEPAQQVHPAELQQLYTMLSDSAEGIQSAASLLRKSSAAMAWLQQQKDAVLNAQKRESSRLDYIANQGPEAQAIQKRLTLIGQDYNTLIDSPEMEAFLAEAQKRAAHFFVQNKIYAPPVPQRTDENFCFALNWFPFPVAAPYAAKLKKKLGGYYDPASKCILAPICFPAERLNAAGNYAEFRLCVTFEAQTEQITYGLVRSFLFNILRSYVPLPKRVLYIDLDTWNPEYLGFMKQFAGEQAMIATPLDEKAALRELSNMESDAYAEPEAKRNRRFIIIRGNASHSSGSLESTLSRIAKNGKKNNIGMVAVTRQVREHSAENAVLKAIPFTIRADAEAGKFYTTAFHAKTRIGFHGSPGGIAPEAAASLRTAYTPKPVSNRYEDAFDLSKPISYTRERRPITLTYGIDRVGRRKSATFEGVDFAAFLMGASGYGKSTAIHAMITNLICNYHPDEVELWLADFKMETFSYYKDPCPPHIRYILMDDSRELVFDFIRRMHDELIRREGILSALHFDDRKDLPVTRYLPAVFIIIDEFTVMANAVKDEPFYRDLIQDLLVKGRSNGFRFLFASQKYTVGASALTATAKDQIGLRLSMGSPDILEIKETLAIPENQYTDQMGRMVSHLTVYHILQRSRKKDGTFFLEDIMPYYFPGKGEEAWPSRYALFRRLNQTMRKIPQENYTGKAPDSYVDKRPSFVIRGDFEAFRTEDFLAKANSFVKKIPGGLGRGDFLLRLGVPRVMESDSMATLTSSEAENLFLLSTDQEVSCAASVVLSAARSANLQGVQTAVWTDNRNRIQRIYGNILRKLTYKEGKDAIRSEVFELVDSIRSGRSKPSLIILLGLQNLLVDLSDSSDDDSFFAPSCKDTLQDSSELYAVTGAEKKIANRYEEMQRRMFELADAVEEECEAKGWSFDQIQVEVDRRCQAFAAKMGLNFQDVDPSGQTSAPVEVRNAKEELFRLIQSGGKYGCHFLIYANTYQALRAVGLSVGQFKHRICFRTDSAETSLDVLGSSAAYRLPEHSAYYRSFGSSAEQYPFMPYLHPGVTWGNWTIDKTGKAVNAAHV